MKTKLMRKEKKAFFFIFFCIFLSVVSKPKLTAQTIMRQHLERMWEDAWLEMGPFRLNLVLFINNAGYDSNVYYETSEPIRDFTLTTGPGLTVYLPFKKRIVFEIYASPQYVYFKETERERTWNKYFHGKVHFFVSRFLFSFGRGFSDARQRWNTEIDIRPRRKADSLQGSVLWQTSRKTAVSFGYRQDKYDYENLFYERYNFRDQLNRREDFFNLIGYYQLSFRNKIFIDLEYGHFDFDNPRSLRNSESYGFYGGFEFAPLGRMTGRIRLGYKIFKSLDRKDVDYKGLVGDTDYSIRLTKFLRVRALYKRDSHFSIYYESLYYIENRYGAGLSVYPFRRIRLDYDYSVGRNSYPAQSSKLVADGEIQQQREDEYQTHSVGIYFRLKRNIGVGVVFYRWKRDSSWRFKESERDFVGVNLTYDF